MVRGQVSKEEGYVINVRGVLYNVVRGERDTMYVFFLLDRGKKEFEGKNKKKAGHRVALSGAVFNVSTKVSRWNTLTNVVASRDIRSDSEPISWIV